MRINSFALPSTPVPDGDVPEFRKCVLVDEERAVYDLAGKKVTKETIKVSRAVSISPEEFRNDGVSCDLFGIEVQLKAGVQLHEFNSQFYGVPLESRQELESLVNASLDNIEAGLNSNDSSSINFN